MIRQTAAPRDTLRNFAAGYSQDLGMDVGTFLAPWVPCGVAIGYYKRYDDVDALRVYETARAVGGSARRVEFLATDPTFSCAPHALETPIDDTERPEASTDVDLSEQSKATSLVNLAYLAAASRVVTKAKTLTAAANLGNYNNSDADPVAEIDACIRTIATATMQMPNRIAFGLAAWERFKNHPKTLKRNPAWALVDGGQIMVAPGLFANPAIRILVSPMGKDLASGGTSAKSNLLGDDLFVFIADANPTPYSAQWMSRFTTRPGGIDAIRTYRAENVRSDILALDWSEDLQIVSSLAAARITTNG